MWQSRSAYVLRLHAVCCTSAVERIDSIYPEECLGKHYRAVALQGHYNEPSRWIDFKSCRI